MDPGASEDGPGVEALQREPQQLAVHPPRSVGAQSRFED